jgi:phage-related protein
MRDLDARRLMNDVRQGMGLETIKEQIKLPYNALREKYFQGEIYQVGDIVESINGEQYEIIKRGTNHLLVKNQAGIVESKWIHEVVQKNT